MSNSVRSSSGVFPTANVRFQVDETVAKILLKSKNLQFFLYNHRASKKHPLRENHCTALSNCENKLFI